MLTGSPGPRQPRPSAPMCVELGSAAADGEILIQSKVLCAGFDQIEPRARGQRARLPSFHRCILNSIWEMNRKSRNALNPSFVYKSCFEPRRMPAFHVSAQSLEPRAPLEKRDRISRCKQVLTLQRAYFWLQRRGGEKGCRVGEKAPNPAANIIEESQPVSQRLTAEHVAALLQSERLRLCN